ncbi:MAG TPA: peptide deformylase [Candidatus Ratteibacteria bacterium]|jgi:peptide deformylase|uniref:Peptide deformylase n=1 Tax=candidate division TA06 bacterium ADurb.Bin131 TaxID=1852827 RepID=A0A1V6C5S1_UNCT6|nr:MAG: Peptide deformylase [candidate division TA06 bacterium ADurb.Bin131]HOC02747.1 peptide deformylase [bacterium]HRS06932.1 peptide deformylase [Candidatus Ratteibacteria bacterium]HON06245.1 peptide deformylase [bacterium]HQL64925.1 peptide deformylase [bacterium]
MTVKRIKKYGAEILREKSKEITDFGKKTRDLFDNLEDTLAKAGGLGLAAPQIGIGLRAFVAFDKDKRRIFRIVNPEVLYTDDEEEIDMEGCLSFPEIFFSINRPKSVLIRGLTNSGKKIEIKAEGLLARCFLHEIEHLDGILIIDHASSQEKQFWQERLKQITSSTKK